MAAAPCSSPTSSARTSQTATEELEEAGFVVDSERVANDEVAADVVISQDPPAAQRIDEGDTVTLQVSSGVGEVEIPDLENQLAERRARPCCNSWASKSRPSPSRATTSTRAASSAPIPPRASRPRRGSIVLIVVSSGREQVPVPDVVGLQSEEGAGRAHREPDSSPTRRRKSSDTVESGRVIRTEPPRARSSRRAVRAVRMFVSSGTRTVAVPEVRGQTLNAAPRHAQRTRTSRRP